MKLLIVGLGSMGKRRARLTKGIDAAIQIVGVDTAESRRDEALRLGLADAAYTTIGEAVAAEHPDAALVCTAPLAHAAVIGELLDHDLPVFTELNLVSDGYRENMAKAAAKKLPLFLSSTMLYRRETQYIKQQVAEFGKPVHYIYHIGQYLPDWHPWENYKNFFVGNARTGGVREIFGIDLPWLLDAFGDVESVTVQKDTISDLGLPYPDCVTLLLRHKGGVQGVLAADVVSRKAVRSFECFGDGIHLFWDGDWAKDRIIVDCVKAFSRNEVVEIRSPKATRPWQHVLEPLSGYLNLGQYLYEGKVKNGEPFNFGPRAEQTKTVFQLVQDLAELWGLDRNTAARLTGNVPFEEATLLKLNCDKALAYLDWHSTLHYEECVHFIADWYKAFYTDANVDMYSLTTAQIDSYVRAAGAQHLKWAE